jgi:hypothetical protein
VLTPCIAGLDLFYRARYPLLQVLSYSKTMIPLLQVLSFPMMLVPSAAGRELFQHADPSVADLELPHGAGLLCCRS